MAEKKSLLEQLNENWPDQIQRCKSLGVYVTEVEQGLGPVLQVMTYPQRRLHTCITVLDCYTYLSGLEDGFYLRIPPWMTKP